MRSLRFVSILAALLPLAAAGETPAPADPAPAPLFDGMGKQHRQVRTTSKQAQRYFDQGLVLTYGFNHAEAGRSFREAAAIDPGCAMAYWGIAYVLGPNINVPFMDPADVPVAWEAAQEALRLAKDPRERAYAEALAKRYAPEPPADRAPLDSAYAAAMREIVKRWPKDDDAAALFAEAMMNLRPWRYWTKAGEAEPGTAEIVATLERVLHRNPDHVGAAHYYIHATEASQHPEKAEPYADRLRTLVPGAGHLVHMPAHTFMRVGRYADASAANVRATQVDDTYISQCHAQGVYPLAYVPHNHHFLWASASMEGRSAAALAAAGATDAHTAHELQREAGLGALQHFAATPYWARTRFGKWDEILSMPAPAADLPYHTGVWRYARGLAFARTGRPAEAEGELAALAAIATRDTLANVTIFINNVQQVLAVACQVLAGETAAARGNSEQAIAHLRRGAALEDELAYNEPADWFFPVRHVLGAVLLEAGKPAEAETAYREDLAVNRENGWALFGLAQSLEAQGRSAEAAAVRARFARAWRAADVTLVASRF